MPAVEQGENLCGPAALSSILAWAGRPEPAAALADRVYLPVRRGTLPIDLAREIRLRGLLAYRVRPDLGELLGEVAAAHPVLVLENRGLAWVPLWHYSVLTGYDLEAGRVTLLAGGSAPEGAALGAFARSWRRAGSVGLLALPPGELPAAADPEGILSALADLEETGQAGAAASGYRAYATRWPRDWQGAFGLGNALYAGADAAGAEAAFRRAAALAPGRPEPPNNLALLALGAGRRREAVELAASALAAARALALDPKPYEETLRECEGVTGAAGPREPPSASSSGP